MRRTVLSSTWQHTPLGTRWRGSSISALRGQVGTGVSEKESVTGKIFLGYNITDKIFPVTGPCKCAVFGIKPTYRHCIITKFSSKVSICTHQKFQLGGQCRGRPLSVGAWPPCPPLRTTLWDTSLKKKIRFTSIRGFVVVQNLRTENKTNKNACFFLKDNSVLDVRGFSVWCVKAPITSITSNQLN